MVDRKRPIYILIYFFELLSGVIVYLISGNDQRAKFHSKQAIILGLVTFILGFIPIVSILNIFIWIYGLYIGIKAYNGIDIALPMMKVPNYSKPSTDAKQEVGSTRTLKTKKTQKTIKKESKALSVLKLRYANGKITKKQYLRMKKDLE